MVTTPTFKRQESVQAGSGLSGVSNALQGQAQNYSAFANLASNVAGEAAIERSRIEGIQAGQTPGQDLLPEITPSGKAFADAYRTESTSIVTMNAQDSLQKLLFEASKNPSIDTLGAYRKETRGIIEKLSPLIPEEMRPEFQRRLASAASDGSLKLEAAIESRNLKNLSESQGMAHAELSKDDFTQSSDEEFERLDGLKFSGEIGAGTEKIDTRTDKSGLSIQQQQKNEKSGLDKEREARRGNHEKRKQAAEEHRNNLVSMGALSPAMAKKQEQELELSAAKGAAVGAKNYAEKTKTTPEFFKKMVDEPNSFHFLKGKPYETQREIINFTLKDHLQNESLMKSQQQMEMNKYEALLSQNLLTPENLSQAEVNLTPENYSKLELSLAKAMAKENKNLFDFSEGQAISNNPVALADKKPEYLENLFNGTVNNLAKSNNGQPISQEQIFEAVSGIAAAVPSVNKRLNAAMESGNAQAIIDSSKMIRALTQKQPLSINDVSEKNKSKAAQFETFVTHGFNEQEAAQLTMERFAGKTDKEIEERANSYDDFQKVEKIGKNHWGNTVNHVAKGLGADEAELPDGITIDYQRLHRGLFMSGLDWETADKRAFEKLNQVVGVSDVNGRKQVLNYAPEKIVQGFGPWFRNQGIAEFEKTADLIKTEFDRKGSTQAFYYEIPDGQIAKIGPENKTTGFIERIQQAGKNLAAGVEAEKKGEPHKPEKLERTIKNAQEQSRARGTIKVRKVMRDRTFIEGELQILPDGQTLMMKGGEQPSFGLYFVKNNLANAVSNPANQNAALRFRPQINPGVIYSQEQMTLENLRREEENAKRKAIESFKRRGGVF